MVGNRDHAKWPIFAAVVPYHTIDSFTPGTGAKLTGERSDRDLNRTDL
jgi:hypothetical protein